MSLPHARGGVSIDDAPDPFRLGSSPRPWGCFYPNLIFWQKVTVFPTPVGVFLYRDASCAEAPGLPHARGGVSNQPQITSPPSAVFPTPVGVFPPEEFNGAMRFSLPHARGGVSGIAGSQRTDGRSSPRPWGCFRFRVSIPLARAVFPTPVGVFLDTQNRRDHSGRLPHARGGVSFILYCKAKDGRSSPRPWGCF